MNRNNVATLEVMINYTKNLNFCQDLNLTFVKVTQRPLQN